MIEKTMTITKNGCVDSSFELARAQQGARVRLEFATPDGQLKGE